MSEAFIIAIDFGTTFSGYAYSLTPTNRKTAPNMRLWRQRTCQETSKTPTCILFNKNEEFVDFGYKAREKYYEIHKDTTKYFYFKDFKMELYRKNHQITKTLVIKDVNKKSMSALKVFSEALRYLKEDALSTIMNNTQYKVKYVPADFTWVLTVPAIWDSPARQFMREAAVQAGIVSSSTDYKLVMALEPEAASVWCKQLPPEDFMEDKVDVKMSTGTQYIVVDCGGGTIDITVHEVLDGGKLKELHKATGNDKGGRKVDRKFTQCMRELFCDGLWEEYERDHPKEALQFMEDFVYVRQADHSRQLEFYKEFRDMVERKKNKTVFKPIDGIDFRWAKKPSAKSYVAKLEISEKRMESFFLDTLIHLTNSLHELLTKGVKYIILVGGLSSSHIIREHIRREFSDQVKVLCPRDPQEVVLKGAVLFGRDQSVISSRKSAFTYGFSKVMRFDPLKHKAEKKITTKDGDWCRHLFRKMVEINEDVGWAETRKFSIYPVEGGQKQMSFDFYRTEKKDPTYIDEWGVEGPVASCDVSMPDFKKGMDREVKLEILFGSTGITALATDVGSKSKASVKMDFLPNQ